MPKILFNNLFNSANGWPRGSQVGPPVASQVGHQVASQVAPQLDTHLGSQAAPQVLQQGNFMTSAPQLVQKNNRTLTSAYAQQPLAPMTLKTLTLTHILDKIIFFIAPMA